MTPRTWIFLAALLGGLAVALGAFGAHGLPDYLAKQGVTGEEVVKRLANWETAAKYQMYHALAILAVFAGDKLSGSTTSHLAAWSWLGGTLIFSGCLYLLVVTGVKILGAIVPIGGLLLIAGWVLLAVSAFQAR